MRADGQRQVRRVGAEGDALLVVVEVRCLFAARTVAKTLGLQPGRAQRASTGLGAPAQQHEADFLARLVVLAVVLPQQFGPGAVLEFFRLAGHFELQFLRRWQPDRRRRARLGLVCTGRKNGQCLQCFGCGWARCC